MEAWAAFFQMAEFLIREHRIAQSNRGQSLTWHMRRHGGIITFSSPGDYRVCADRKKYAIPARLASFREAVQCIRYPHPNANFLKV